jgi:NAD(P) transhydrogenase subunit alpha
MIVGVPRETCPDERRVAVVPSALGALKKKGVEWLIEAGAGAAAGYPDQAYEGAGAKIAATRDEVFQKADVVVQVHGLGSNPQAGAADVARMRKDQVLISFQQPLTAHEATKKLAERGVTAFAMELMPRITRAQSMDALSSMANIAGYKAVLLAAAELPKLFPLMMTAAGTITAAKVFVVGAGVAGLQAIATARRLGAVVEAYDVRPAVKEQVESLGARFVDLPLEGAEGQGGYAKAMDETFYRKQRELMTRVLAAHDVAITTAAVPGKRAPVLVTTAMVEGMAPGSVVIDLAAESGGNCELTQAGQRVAHQGVTILGPVNLASTVPYHASQMYAKNITTFLGHLIDKEGKLALNAEDEITRETMMTCGGQVVHARLKELR